MQTGCGEQHGEAEAQRRRDRLPVGGEEAAEAVERSLRALAEGALHHERRADGRQQRDREQQDQRDGPGARARSYGDADRCIAGK